jgi:hypothetical protein
MIAEEVGGSCEENHQHAFHNDDIYLAAFSLTTKEKDSNREGNTQKKLRAWEESVGRAGRVMSCLIVANS